MCEVQQEWLDKVLLILSYGPHRQNEIVKKTGISKTKVFTVLKTLLYKKKIRGTFRETKDGRLCHLYHLDSLLPD